MITVSEVNGCPAAFHKDSRSRANLEQRNSTCSPSSSSVEQEGRVARSSCPKRHKSVPLRILEGHLDIRKSRIIDAHCRSRRALRIGATSQPRRSGGPHHRRRRTPSTPRYISRRAGPLPAFAHRAVSSSLSHRYHRGPTSTIDDRVPGEAEKEGRRTLRPARPCAISTSRELDQNEQYHSQDHFKRKYHLPATAVSILTGETPGN
ncbi:unnamed protein product [Trichogramma brassicae]|uniref:Uncharacterized protein n=1 Tax=Trichogramma brassicae TaxID=86971 RepID=A0A6H5ILN7_9HYME|nr:unnamed protein product [Trichogramma brassicae]